MPTCYLFGAQARTGLSIFFCSKNPEKLEKGNQVEQESLRSFAVLSWEHGLSQSDCSDDSEAVIFLFSSFAHSVVCDLKKHSAYPTTELTWPELIKTFDKKNMFLLFQIQYNS